MLLAGGFDGADAAMLIGYVVGLPECDSRWSLEQINRLLFLRNLYSNPDFLPAFKLQDVTLNTSDRIVIGETEAAAAHAPRRRRA